LKLDHGTRGSLQVPKRDPSKTSEGPSTFLDILMSFCYVWIVPQLTWIVLMVTLAAPRWMRVLSLLVHVYPFVIPRKKNGIGAGKKILNSVRKFLSCTTTWDDRKR